ncbi:MAG: S8 family serine peptidase [Planctomycetota bacterium]
MQTLIKNVPCAAIVWTVALGAAAHATPVQSASSAATDLIAGWDLDRVLEADLLAERLVDVGRSDVVVTLHPTPLSRDATNLRDPDLLLARRGEVRAVVDSVLADANLSTHRRLETLPIFSVEADSIGISRLLLNPAVRWIEPERIHERMDLEGVLMSGVNYAYKALGAGAGTYDDITGKGVSIAILDDGLNFDNPYLGAGVFPNDKVIGGVDLADGDSTPKSPFDHGTKVGGVAAMPYQTSGTYLSPTGMAPDAKLYGLKLWTDSDQGPSDFLSVQGLEWVALHQYDDPANPIRVVNMSYGIPCTTYQNPIASGSIYWTVQNLNALGIVVISSAGNSYDPFGITYPAAIANIISVGAVYDHKDDSVNLTYTNSCTGTQITEKAEEAKVCAFSCAGNILDLFAPSYKASTTSGGGLVSDFSGTSAAAPYVAGVCALLFEWGAKVGLDPTPAEIRAALQESWEPVTDHRSGITKPLLSFEAAMFLGMPGAAKLRVSKAGPDLLQWGAGPGFLVFGDEHGTPIIPIREVSDAVGRAAPYGVIEIDVPSAPWTIPGVIPFYALRPLTYKALGADLVLSHPGTYQ